MTVNPGFGGQASCPRCCRRSATLRALCDARGLAPRIEVDGGQDGATRGRPSRPGPTRSSPALRCSARTTTRALSRACALMRGQQPACSRDDGVDREAVFAQQHRLPAPRRRSGRCRARRRARRRSAPSPATTPARPPGAPYARAAAPRRGSSCGCASNSSQLGIETQRTAMPSPRSRSRGARRPARPPSRSRSGSRRRRRSSASLST